MKKANTKSTKKSAAKKNVVQKSEPPRNAARAAMKILERTAGISTSSADTTSFLNEQLRSFLGSVVKAAVIISQNDGRVTTMGRDVTLALSLNNVISVSGFDEKPDRTAPLKSGTTRHLKANTAANRQIKKLQKSAKTTVAIARTIIHRMAVEAAAPITGYDLSPALRKDASNKLVKPKFAKEAITELHISGESYLIQLLKDAGRLIPLRDSKRLMKRDLEAAIEIRGPTIVVAPVMGEVGLETYIPKVLQQVHPDTSITSRATSVLNSAALSIVGRLMGVVNSLGDSTKRSTLSWKLVESAVKIVLPGKLGEHAVTEGNKAVKRYQDAVNDPAPPKKSSKKNAPVVSSKIARKTRAGLVISVSRIEKAMQGYAVMERKSGTASVYLTAVIEYLLAELLEISGNNSRNDKKVRIKPRHILLAVRGDAELNHLFPERYYLFEGGVVSKSAADAEEAQEED